MYSTQTFMRVRRLLDSDSLGAEIHRVLRGDSVSSYENEDEQALLNAVIKNAIVGALIERVRVLAKEDLNRILECEAKVRVSQGSEYETLLADFRS